MARELARDVVDRLIDEARLQLSGGGGLDIRVLYDEAITQGLSRGSVQSLGSRLVTELGVDVQSVQQQLARFDAHQRQQAQRNQQQQARNGGIGETVVLGLTPSAGRFMGLDPVDLTDAKIYARALAIYNYATTTSWTAARDHFSFRQQTDIALLGRVVQAALREGRSMGIDTANANTGTGGGNSGSGGSTANPNSGGGSGSGGSGGNNTIIVGSSGGGGALGGTLVSPQERDEVRRLQGWLSAALALSPPYTGMTAQQFRQFSEYVNNYIPAYSQGAITAVMNSLPAGVTAGAGSTLAGSGNVGVGSGSVASLYGTHGVNSAQQQSFGTSPGGGGGTCSTSGGGGVV